MLTTSDKSNKFKHTQNLGQQPKVSRTVARWFPTRVGLVVVAVAGAGAGAGAALAAAAAAAAVVVVVVVVVVVAAAVVVCPRDYLHCIYRNHYSPPPPSITQSFIIQLLVSVGLSQPANSASPGSLVYTLMKHSDLVFCDDFFQYPQFSNLLEMYL